MGVSGCTRLTVAMDAFKSPPPKAGVVAAAQTALAGNREADGLAREAAMAMARDLVAILSAYYPPAKTRLGFSGGKAVLGGQLQRQLQQAGYGLLPAPGLRYEAGPVAPSVWWVGLRFNEWRVDRLYQVNGTQVQAYGGSSNGGPVTMPEPQPAARVLPSARYPVDLMRGESPQVLDQHRQVLAGRGFPVQQVQTDQGRVLRIGALSPAEAQATLQALQGSYPDAMIGELAP
ncbi:MAG: hypothetical protein KDI44_15495 [Thiothrix sp.]|nr:hypothetical protein [Thiothrix sp.]HPQ97441.1 hypothetical protein [Thiolinea sp.]